MNTSGLMLFWVSAAVALGSAVGTISMRNPLRAAVSLLIHILSLCGIYLSLKAHLLATIQVLVYAGAVVVLFIFVIMLIGPTANEQRAPRAVGTRILGAVGALLSTSVLAFTLVRHDAQLLPIPQCPPGAGAECGQFGGVTAVGAELYLGSMVPFELVSILLTVAIVGAIAVAKGKTTATSPKNEGPTTPEGAA